MSGGKRFKFAGSKIAVLLGFDEAGELEITEITNTNPAVLTIADHGLEIGGILHLKDIEGMEELNETVVVIEAVTENSITLADVDATEYGVFAGAGTAVPGVVSNFCELTQYTRTGGTSGEMDATTICSKAKEFEVDLPDFGTTQLGYNFAPRTAVQGKLEDAYRSSDVTGVVVKLPKNGGHMIQLGYVQQTSETSGNGTLWTATATIRNTGARIDLQ
ncbi:phage tail tube protein [Oxalicibacterium faecigallinarum]|uniref:Phage tail protein n=1 Tax=Oxalicibacterium faecigallinarum TaxID=573741 RepID=A0A8J3F480_9BURK|nr:phage tail tube protein [Oxalicibacterium faecigallinarum]GGI16446.1 hypothetical protein GCM10008066_04000 [Oxalicibacterium faecigallinarum]